jgi:hypothetical protein
MRIFGNITPSPIIPILLVVGIASSLLGLADDDLEVGKKSKELVDEMKEKERKLREESEKKIGKERESALKELEKLLKLYQSRNKKAEADSIEKEIDLLKKKMGLPGGIRRSDRVRRPDREAQEEKQNRYFEYQTNYLFNEKGVISGKFSFLSNQKVKITYNYKGKDISQYWKWKDMGDHVKINAGSLLGTIIISEYPSSDLKSLLIRWGGELTNKLTDGHAE